APTHHYYGLYLVTQRRAAEALVELKRAQNLDPLSAMIAVNAVWPYYFAAPAARNYDQALADLHRIIAVEPNFHSAYIMLGIVYAGKGMHQQALVEVNRALQSNRNGFRLSFLGYVYARSGQTKEARKVLGELQQMEKEHYVAARAYATIYAGLGEKEQ